VYHYISSVKTKNCTKPTRALVALWTQTEESCKQFLVETTVVRTVASTSSANIRKRIRKRENC